MIRGRARISRGEIILFYCAFLRPHLDNTFSFDPQIWEGHGPTGMGSGDTTGMMEPAALAL